MGMDLVGEWRKSVPENIQKDPAGPYLHYNWTGWSYICNLMDKLGVDTEQFSGSNDGAELNGITCKAVANALDTYVNSKECSDTDKAWLSEHIPIWRWTKLFKQC
jgi:hypothetical protein